MGQHLAEALDAGGCQGADRAGRDRVDAGAFWAQAGGQVADAGFQTGLGHAHDVVVRHGALGAQIGQRQQAAVTAFHHFATGLGQRDKAIGADVVGDAETFTGGDFGKVAVQLVARGKADGVHDAIQAVPLFRQLDEYLFDLGVIGHIAGEAQLRTGAPAGSEFFNPAFQLFVLIGEGQFGALAVHGRGNAGGNGQFAGDANDEYALSAEKSHSAFLFSAWPYRPCYRFAAGQRPLPATDEYTRAAEKRRCRLPVPVLLLRPGGSPSTDG